MLPVLTTHFKEENDISSPLQINTFVNYKNTQLPLYTCTISPSKSIPTQACSTCIHHNIHCSPTVLTQNNVLCHSITSAQSHLLTSVHRLPKHNALDSAIKLTALETIPSHGNCFTNSVLNTCSLPLSQTYTTQACLTSVHIKI